MICWSEDQDTGFHDHDDSPPLRRTGAYRVGRDGTLERESQAFETELRGEPALA